MSSKQKGDGTGKLELTVKMDYSETYRENDRLDQHLDQHLGNLNRDAYRARTEKEDELETAKADADNLLKLKEAVNTVRQQEGLHNSTIVSPSMPRLSSASSAKSSLRGGRGPASADKNNNRKSSVGVRRPSTVSSITVPSQDSSGDGEGSDSVDFGPAVTAGSAFRQLAEAASSGSMAVRAMTLTERRWAEEKAKFTAKNLFNVRRSNNATVGHFMIDQSTRHDNSGDAGRRGAASAMSSDRNVSSSSSAYGRQLPGKRNKRNRSAPLFVRLTQSNLDEDSRKPRSRRELKQLSDLSSDSLTDRDSVLKRPMTCAGRGGPGSSGSGDGSGNVKNVTNFQQDILQRLRGGRSQLQERVSMFLKEMDDFNKRGQKSVLDQILEGT